MSVIAHKEEIIRQYAQGEDISALARQYGCHYSWIRNILVRNGINIRAPRYNKSVGRIVHVAGRSRSVFWSKQMEDELRRIFPRSFNAELCEYFGLSQRTILRKARQMGLQKDPEWQHQNCLHSARMAHIAARAKGYPGHFKKGHPANEFSFKKGHKESEEVKQKRVATLRRTLLIRPEITVQRGLSIAAYNKAHPEAVAARIEKMKQTKRNKKSILCQTL